jgi:hypothetical protein
MRGSSVVCTDLPQNLSPTAEPRRSPNRGIAWLTFPQLQWTGPGTRMFGIMDSMIQRFNAAFPRAQHLWRTHDYAPGVHAGGENAGGNASVQAR